MKKSYRNPLLTSKLIWLKINFKCRSVVKSEGTSDRALEFFLGFDHHFSLIIAYVVVVRVSGTYREDDIRLVLNISFG